MIEEIYLNLCGQDSDISDFLPVLRSYANKSEVVVELGVRYIVSTWALLAGRPKKLISYDIKHPKDYGAKLEYVDIIAQEIGVNFEFMLGDSTAVDIPECDLLFIDTIHTYEHLSKELERHKDKARKWIILHDSNLPGIKEAVEEKLSKEWKIKEEFPIKTGLLVMERNDL